MQRRQGIFQRIMGALGRLANLGGGAEQAPPPAPTPSEPPPQYEQFEQLPQQPAPPPPPVPEQEQITFYEPTPVYPMGDNTEYIPGHMSGSNGKNPIYGRWRVTNPELGDLSDLISKVPQGRVTFVICGDLEIYANMGVHQNDCKSYAFNTADIDAMLDSQEDSEGNDIEFAQDLINDLLSREGTEFSSISEIQIINKEDDPRVYS
jgi:hypothetical protein